MKTARTWEEQLETLSDSVKEAQKDGDRICTAMAKTELERVRRMGKAAWEAEG